jgi:hypothetical protein
VSAVVHACLVAVLLYAGLSGPGQHTAAADSQEQAAQVVLSNGHPESSFAIAPDVLTGSRPLLALSFPRVVNPSNTGFQIWVYFSYRRALAASSAPLRILVGNGSLFPADRPGGLVLRASKAFTLLRTDQATDVRLVLELKPINDAQSWPPMEVTVAAPQWRQENRV